MKPIPAALLAPVQLFPLFGSRVVAGFPSPADDYIEARLDLNEHLVKHKEATYFLWVKGDSMKKFNINDGDMVIVDRSLEPRHDRIVVAAVHGELTLKKLYKQRGVVKLLAGNESYPEIVVAPDNELIVWGVVKHVVHTFT